MKRNHLILAVTAVAIAGALTLRARRTSERADSHVVVSAAVTEPSASEPSASEPSASEPPASEPRQAGAPIVSPAAKPRLIELGADSCASCKAMVPVLAELREEHAGELRVDFIDVWKFPAEAEPFHLRVIPTQVFLAPDGSELARHEGFYAADAIRERWASLGFPLGAESR